MIVSGFFHDHSSRLILLLGDGKRPAGAYDIQSTFEKDEADKVVKFTLREDMEWEKQD